ncbi:MAG: hypothetical protein AAFV29_16445 [Myxococcota bacterium]
MSEQKQPTTDESWTDAERAVLAAWKIAPSPDHADAVVAATQPSRPAVQRWFSRRVSWGLAAAVAALWAIQLSPLTWPQVGQFSKDVTTELDMGGRAVVVTEGPTEVSWSIDWSGSAKVRQTSGRVFYRVESGPSFEIVTPSGTIAVRGTCLSVEVKPMNTTQSALLGTAFGAAVATLVTVMVHEGRVEVSHEGQAKQVIAGQQAVLGSSHRAAVVRSMRQAKEESFERSARTSAALAPPAPSKAEVVADAPATIAALRVENRALSMQVDALRDKLVKLESNPENMPIYDPSPEALAQMAKRCELAWDMPQVTVGETRNLSTDIVSKLELSQSETDVINRLLVEHNEQMVAETQRLYTAITGDDQVGSLSAQSMFSEVNDKVSQLERQTVFQQLSAERAGLRPPPAPEMVLSPVEQLFRLYVGAGDQLEQALGAELGPDMARRIRAADDGFSTRLRMSPGCPSAR